MGGSGKFTEAEYAQRLAGVKARMEKAGFDLIICQDPANMCWLTGYDGWSFYVPQCVLVHLEEEPPIWFGRAQDAKSARMTTGLPERNIVPFSERLVQQPVEHPYDELADLIRTRGWSRRAHRRRDGRSLLHGPLPCPSWWPACRTRASPTTMIS